MTLRNALTILAASAAMASTLATAQTADERKADYLYMEALRQYEQGNNDAYFSLLSRALELNPESSEIGNAVGFIRLGLSRGDNDYFASGLALCNQYCREHPEDTYAGYNLASVYERLDCNEVALEIYAKLDSLNPDVSGISVRYADMLAGAGESDKALNVYRRVERREGTSIELTSRIAGLYFETGDTVAVRTELANLCQSMPLSAPARTFSGVMLQQLGDNDSALEKFNEAVALDSTYGMAYYLKAEYYRSKGDTDAFEREIYNALGQSDLDLDTKMELLHRYVTTQYSDESKRPKIEALFNSMLEQNPHEAALHRMFMAYYATVGDHRAAIEQLDYAMSLEPDDVDNWILLIRLNATVEDYPAAISAAQEALRYFENNIEVLKTLAGIYMLGGQIDEAFATIDKAMEYAEDDADRSELMSLKGDIAQEHDAGAAAAAEYYEKALEYNAENHLAMNNYAYFLACQGTDLEKAAKMSELSMLYRPGTATYLDTYAWIMFRMANYPKAKEYIDKALRATDDEDMSADLLEHAGDIYFMAGEPDKALEYWQRAQAIDPDNELLNKKVKNKTFFYE
jgi:tetratricopeptide (TPR) repeat protein